MKLLLNMLSVAIAGSSVYAAEIVNRTFETSENWPNAVSGTTNNTTAQGSYLATDAELTDGDSTLVIKNISTGDGLAALISETESRLANGTQAMHMRNVGGAIVLNPSDNNGISALTFSCTEWSSANNVVMKVYVRDAADNETQIGEAGGYSPNTSMQTYTINDINAMGDAKIVFRIDSAAAQINNGIFVDDVSIIDYKTQQISATNVETADTLHEVYGGVTDLPLVRIIVEADGVIAPYRLNELALTLVGHEQMDQVKVYYTGNDTVFAKTTLLTTATNPQSTLTLSGLTQELTDGANYFWLACDVKSNAPNTTIFDAACNQMILNNGSSSNFTPTVTAPAGAKYFGVNKRLFFDGTDDYVEIQPSSDYDKLDGGGYTVELWVQTTDTAGTLVSNYDDNDTDGDGGFEITQNNGVVEMRFILDADGVGNGDLRATLTNSNDPINDGQWHHVAMVLDPTGQIRGYVNGQQTGSWSNGGMSRPGNSDHPLRIGAQSTQSGLNRGYLAGSVADLRIWQSVRTAEQMMADKYTRFLPAPTELVGYWPIDEGTGTDVRQAASGGGNGTVVNSAIWQNSVLPIFKTPENLLVTDLLLTATNRITTGAVSTSATALEIHDTNNQIATGESILFAATNERFDETTLQVDITDPQYHRSVKTWYVQSNTAASRSVNLVFNMKDLDTFYEVNTDLTNYALLYRSEADSLFYTDVIEASSVEVTAAGSIEFNNVPLKNGYYALGSVSVFSPVLGLELTLTDDLLHWQTVKESGVSHYEVQQFIKGYWTTIQTIQAGSNSYVVQVNPDLDVRLKVVDHSGFVQSFLPNNHHLARITFTLTPGWNLLSMPFEHANLAPLLNHTLSEPMVWNGDTYQFTDKLTVGQGFFIYSMDTAEVVIEGERSMAELDLKSGWNLSGVTENREIPENVKAVYTHDSTYQDVLETGILIEGIGYWIYLD